MCGTERISGLSPTSSLRPALVVGDCAAPGFSKTEEVVIPWCKIVRIGDDVILVDIAVEECRCACKEKDKENKKKKRGFFC